MRILNLTQTYAPFLEFGGPPVKVRALSEALARRGHAVTVLTADWGLEERFPDLASHAAMDRSPFGWRAKENGVTTIYLPTWLALRAATWNPAVKRYARSQLPHFDVVHIFGLYDLLGPAVAAECRRRGIPYGTEPIGMYVPIVRSLLLKRMYHAFLGRVMLGGSRFVVATSEQELTELTAAGLPREKIVLRRNGVDAPAQMPERGEFRAAHGISPEVNVVLFLGRFSQKKSPDLLMQAFAMLPEPLAANTRLVFAGPDESGMKNRLHEMAEQLGVGSRVQFCDPLFERAKWAAYRDADVFVLPSQNENFGNTAAEAAVAGTPVVLTEKCGIAPLLNGTAGLVVPHSSGAIAHAIESVFTERGLRQRLASGCQEAAAKLGWEEPAREMETLYAGLATPGTGTK
jgi:glycosyltransferase involved in cell wall biosynthesis